MKKDEMIVSFDDSHVEWSYKINNVFTMSINEVYTKLCEAIGSKIYRGKMRAFPNLNAAPAKQRSRQTLRTTDQMVGAEPPQIKPCNTKECVNYCLSHSGINCKSLFWSTRMAQCTNYSKA